MNQRRVNDSDLKNIRIETKNLKKKMSRDTSGCRILKMPTRTLLIPLTMIHALYSSLPLLGAYSPHLKNNTGK
jgi:hypothetical protein